jgi:hypothetical protein
LERNHTLFFIFIKLHRGINIHLSTIHPALRKVQKTYQAYEMELLLNDPIQKASVIEFYDEKTKEESSNPKYL